VDREYTVHGRIAEVYERKGNSYAVLDTMTVDQDGREILRNRHTSLFRLRAESEAGPG
jgi:alpha-amylase/alpha-mannosidase (GH57 family)